MGCIYTHMWCWNGKDLGSIYAELERQEAKPQCICEAWGAKKI